MIETLAAAGLAAIVGSLWRLSCEHAGMRVSLDKGISQVVEQIAGLRSELRKDIGRVEDVLEDHEDRIRRLEREP